MIKRIENIFFASLSKKTLLPGIVGAAFFSVLFYPLTAQATHWKGFGFHWNPFFGIFGDFKDPVANAFATALIAFFNGVFAAIALLLQTIYIGLGEVFIQIITFFVNIPVAPGNPATPPFIQEAWGFSLGLVNGLFLLILVFIGLATILRIQSYQIQQTLPRLIIVAFFVNFSGVFVGLVVDIANLLTIFFLNSVGGVGALFSTNPWDAFSPSPENLGQNIGRILFYIVGIFIYAAITLAFGIRVIVLWTITILAPLAFAASVLPATRPLWNRWLNSLLQWAFFGLPVSFFLFLAGHAIAMDFPGAAASGLDTTITALFAPLTALFILFVGIGISMSIAPASAKSAISFGRKAAIVGTGTFGALALNRYLSREKTKRDQGKSTLLSKVQSIGAGSQGTGRLAKFSRGAATFTGARWATRTLNRQALRQGGKLQKNYEDDKEFDAIAKDKTLIAQEANAMTPGLGTARLAKLVSRAAKEHGSDIEKIFTKNQLKRALNFSATNAPNQLRNIVKYAPDLAVKSGAEKFFGTEDGPKISKRIQENLVDDGLQTEDMIGSDGKPMTDAMGNAYTQYKDKDVRAVRNLPGMDDKLAAMKDDIERNAYLLQQAAVKKLVEGVNAADIENLDQNLIDDSSFREAVVRWKPGSFIRRMVDDWGGLVSEKLQKEAEDIGLKEVAQTNPEFVRLPYTSGGEHLMRDWKDPDGAGDLARDDAKTMVKEQQRIAREAEERRRTPAAPAGGATGPTPGGTGTAGTGGTSTGGSTRGPATGPPPTP